MSNLVMCTSCSGSGIGPSGDTASTCYDCSGTGDIELRDEKGRFKKFVNPTPQPTEDNTEETKND